MTGQATSFFPLQGGLDLITPAIAARPGSAAAALNYEPASNGYRRFAGFERFDGHSSPSDATFWKLAFSSGSAAVSAGQTVTGATSGATGKILAAPTVTAGTYGGANAAGYMGLGVVSGTFVNGENLQVGGVTKAIVSGTVDQGEAPDSATAKAWQAVAIANARALISAVPGSGPVRGVHYYAGFLYAWRDNAGATAAVMHKATAAGWSPVTLSRRLDFTSGGTSEIKEGDTIKGHTSLATALVKRVVKLSGSWSAGTAAGYFVFDAQTGTFGAEDLDVGATLNLATVAGNSVQITLPAGGRYDVLNHNFYGASNLNRMYGCNGVGLGFEFDGTTFCPIVTNPTNSTLDKPTRTEVHNQSLVFSFAGGQLALSAVGLPLIFDGTLNAVTIGTGDDISDLISARGVLTIFCANSIHNLYGSSSSDYQMQVFNADDAGALPWTVQTIGSPIYMDNRGIRSLNASQTFGNFNIGLVSSLVEPLLKQKTDAGILPVAAIRQRAKSLYRLFFSDKTCLSVFFGKKQPEVLPLDLGKVVTCVTAAEDTTHRERIWFGSDDGFVYELDRGTSFDGTAIPHFLRLPFTHFGSPQVRKRFHKAIMECEAGQGTVLSVSMDTDYGDPDSAGSSGTDIVLAGGGGQWDLSAWDSFYWSSPFEGTGEVYLDGSGRNMSLLIAGEAADEPPHLLQGLTVFYSARGLQR